MAPRKAPSDPDQHRDALLPILVADLGVVAVINAAVVVWCTRLSNCIVAAFVLAAIAAGCARADDEIQVYTDELLNPGERGLELHMNFVPSGNREREYAGAQPSGKILRITPEWSFGLAPNWDMGFYLPSTSHDTVTGTHFIDGARIRIKHLQLRGAEAQRFFFGANVEFGYFSLRQSPTHWRAELRGIVGVSTPSWLVALNPILSRSIGNGVIEDPTEWGLQLKVARRVSEIAAVGIEHYAGFGPLRDPKFGSESEQTTFVALDLEKLGPFGINFGIGRGWTNPTDRWTVKAILGIDF